jgi:hypothetical protein
MLSRFYGVEECSLSNSAARAQHHIPLSLIVAGDLTSSVPFTTFSGGSTLSVSSSGGELLGRASLTQ